MESVDIESDVSEMDDENDRLVQDFLNDTRVEAVQAQSRSYDLIYTTDQLRKINLYKAAMTLNRETEAAYKRLEDCFIKMLGEVRSRLKENEAEILKLSKNSNTDGFNYLRCGKPYFKDKNNFAAPENEDAKMMRQAQMYDFSQVCSVPGWTVKDKTEFISAILEMSRDIKRKELRNEIARLRKDNNDLKRIAKLEKEISQLNKKTLNELALPLDQEYDWEVLANSLSRRHTEQEYQALWKLFFHPSINKSSWSKAEHQELQQIAIANKKQDWDNIAKQLNTRRTGYQCFVYYRTNMADNNSKPWTKEEMEYLQRVVNFFREGEHIPWGKVASAMDNRTKIQVYNKYTRMIECRKGRFLEEEDIVLLNFHEKFGNDFRKISQFLPGRSAVQLKTRFRILTKLRQSTTWSVEDDRKLLQIMANLDTYSYSSVTKHFPGKDRINIRSRYVTLTKWMKAHPGCDVTMAPRRGARRLMHGQGAANTNDALANLNKRFVTEVNTKMNKKITRQSREVDIEDGIMVALINEIIKEEGSKKPDLSEFGNDDSPCPLPDASAENSNNLQSLLIFLNANLDKKKFESSKYHAKYPGLSNSTPSESLHKVKSYSKTNKVRTIEMNDFPDIWGEKPKLKRTAYVLPPNYATITGCLGLMKHFSGKPEAKPENDINLSLMQRNNMYLKQEMDKLKQRFTKLFMWPILLSNQLPNINDDKNDEPYVSRPAVEKKCLPNPIGVTIPTPKQCQLNFQGKQTGAVNEMDDDEINEPNQSERDVSETQVSLAIPGCSKDSFSFNEDSLDF